MQFSSTVTLSVLLLIAVVTQTVIGCHGGGGNQKADKCRNILRGYSLVRVGRSVDPSEGNSKEGEAIIPPSLDESSHKKLNRSKRASHQYMRDTSCSDVYAEWKEQYEQWDSYRLGSPPVTYVGYKRVFQSSEPTTVVTHLHAQNPFQFPCPRQDFVGAYWERRMVELGARLGGGRGVKDERGHILASQLCGPIAWYNLAPQTPEVNRNVGNAGGFGWINVENMVAAWVNGGCGTVSLDVFLNYGQNLLSVRPKGFKTCIVFADSYGNVVERGDHYFENGEGDHWKDDDDPDDEL